MASGRFGGVPVTVTSRRKLPARTCRWQAPGWLTARARCWPRGRCPPERFSRHPAIANPTDATKTNR